jgi:hypothetical protein
MSNIQGDTLSEEVSRRNIPLGSFAVGDIPSAALLRVETSQNTNTLTTTMYVSKIEHGNLKGKHYFIDKHTRTKYTMDVDKWVVLHRLIPINKNQREILSEVSEDLRGHQKDFYYNEFIECKLDDNDKNILKNLGLSSE